MYGSSQELTALISSRICHDLASPLGAIANGLELLELTGLADTPEAALLSDSVQSASARIAFFRIAYGPASPDTMISPAVAQKTLAQNFEERKINVSWQAVQDCPRPIAKLLFLIAQSGETALPYGGDLDIQQDGGSWTITCLGREVRMNPDLWGQLSTGNPPHTLQSSQVQFALAHLQSKALSKTIELTETENTLTITVS
jgi:histidine phosphotransferase ChpT